MDGLKKKWNEVKIEINQSDEVYFVLSFASKDFKFDIEFIEYILKDYKKWCHKTKEIFEYYYHNSDKNKSFINNYDIFKKYYKKYGPVVLKYGYKNNKIYDDKNIILDSLKKEIPFKDFLVKVSIRLSRDNDILERIKTFDKNELQWSMTNEQCNHIYHIKKHNRNYSEEWYNINKHNSNKKMKLN